MTDVGTGFLQAISAFFTTKLGKASATTWKDAGSLVDSLHDGVPDNTKPAFEQLKTAIKNDQAIAEPIITAIKKQTDLITKMVDESTADLDAGDFSTAKAGRIAVRLGTALMAVDEAVNIIAKELVKDMSEPQREQTRVALMGIWNPWVQPFRDLADGAGKVLDAVGSTLLGVDSVTATLAESVKDKQLSFDQDAFRVGLVIAGVGERNLGALTLNDTRLEAFFGFSRRSFANPSEEDKTSLVERDGTWWRADQPNLGLRIFVTIQPGIQNNPLLKKIMPGSGDPKTIKPTAVSLDITDGLYLGDGRGAGNEKAVLPVTFSSPVAEIRETALGLVRNAAKEVTGLELTMIFAATLGDAIGLQVVGVGAVIALDGEPTQQSVFPMVVSPRWPDAIGIRINAGVVKGGGYLERRIRTYGTPPVEVAEFGGVIQIEILKVGVYAIGILTPDPFSLVLVMGVRFPVAIELSFGFTFNGVGGILAVNRTVNTTELVAGMKSHFIDSVLFPDDPVAAAPGILDKVAKVFPPAEGGFVIGPIIELGWGSQAKIIEAKLGIVLALPDPKVLILGAVRVRAPSKQAPLTDLRCEVVAEISADRFLLIATLRDSKIAGITVSGDLGLLIQWGGGGAFALSVGGFNPRYTEIPADLLSLERITMDLSPPAVVKIILKVYFAVTAGAVMAGVRGDFSADIGVASAKAWLQLDMIFRWVPRFGFAIDLRLGIDIKVFGCSFASIRFSGTLEGTRPWRIEGTATVDVWWLPTFDFDLGPITWGQGAVEKPPAAQPLALVQEALEQEDAWKALLPHHGDQLAVFGRIEGDDELLAHPLAALEVTQSRLPLETHIDRVGSADVTAHRVAMGLPTTSAGPVAAVSTVTAPFAPGQFLALEGDQLLARSGFDDYPSGCRVAAATTPTHGPAVDDDVRWHTWFREEELAPIDGMRFDFAELAPVLLDHGIPARRLVERENPYFGRVDHSAAVTSPAVSVLPAGAARVVRVDDGGSVLADLGVMTASQAAWAADVVNHSGAGSVVAVAVGSM
jgi:hypothetical protein